MEIRLRNTGQILTEQEFRALHPNTSFPAFLDKETLDHFDADVVLQAPQPEHTDLEIVQRNGATQDSLGNWVQAWEVVSRFNTPEEEQEYLSQRLLDRQKAMKDVVNTLLEEKMTAGYQHDFGAPYGIKTLQTRESDKPNWLSVATAAQVYIANGQGDTVMRAIRTEDNVNVPVTANQALQAMIGMQSYLGSFLDHSWSLKDAIDAANTEADLNLIDVNAGWPSN